MAFISTVESEIGTAPKLAPNSFGLALFGRSDLDCICNQWFHVADMAFNES